MPDSDLHAQAEKAARVALPLGTPAPDAREDDSSEVEATPTYRLPEQRIHLPADLEAWHVSQGCADVVGFILQVNAQMRGKKLTKAHNVSESVQKVLDMLSRFKQWLEDFPPLPQAMRFGNKAFRTWHQHVVQNLDREHALLLSPELVAQGAATEIGYYLAQSFGSAQRIDYGTGHELNFIAWLTCLQKLGVLQTDDAFAIVVDVFQSYLELMRRLQKVYWLEPAGSKGVWGLDDYQFLPLLWGSAQLTGAVDPLGSPQCIHDEYLRKEHAKDYLYLQCIEFIHTVKTGPFFEHSPLLNDISNVATWTKVNSGLIKMYDGEVLGKFPVMQHFYFGSLLSFDACPPDHAFLRRKRARATARAPVNMPGRALRHPVRQRGGAQDRTLGSRAATRMAGTASRPEGTGTAAPWAANRPDGTGTAAPWAANRPTVKGTGTAAPWASHKPAAKGTGKTLHAAPS